MRDPFSLEGIQEYNYFPTVPGFQYALEPQGVFQNARIRIYLDVRTHGYL